MSHPNPQKEYYGDDEIKEDFKPRKKGALPNTHKYLNRAGGKLEQMIGGHTAKSKALRRHMKKLGK